MPLDPLTQRYCTTHGDACAGRRLTVGQRAWYVGLAALTLVAMLWRWEVVFFLLAAGYLGLILFRALATALGLAATVRQRRPPEPRGADFALPTYTVLVPLYHEANIADRIVAALGRLDYPAERLEVLLLLEADDAETRGALDRVTLPPGFAVVTVPPGEPRTKPRACNYGLEGAHGEFCVIFDAEDRPEPDQLRLAVAAFRTLPLRIACLQARLNFYNAKQNLLTRWFAIEYSTYFDLFLPGLQALRVPIPLGGTSNHFRTNVLREVGGWDPFNVTEDCDLGVRLHAAGWRTRMLDSTTWEEANPRLGNWLRQRSRWVKGFFQTHLVHWRRPGRCLARLGPWSALGFVLSVGGSALMLVLNVVFWLVAAVYAGLLAHGVAHGQRAVEFLVQGPDAQALPAVLAVRGYAVRAWPLVYYGPEQDWFWSRLSMVSCGITAALLLANVLFVFTHVLACLRRRRYAWLPAALLMPGYWVLISLGAWRGLAQLLTRPSYWEKTVHGLAREDTTSDT